MRFGSALKMAVLGAAPATPPTNSAALYFKSDGKLYAKDAAGAETLIGPSSSSGGMPVGSIIKYPSATAPAGGWLRSDGSTFSAATYPALNTFLGTNVTPKYAPVNPDTDWATVTGSNGWTAYADVDYQPRFQRRNGVVHIEGLMFTGGASNAIIFNVGVGFRPTKNIIGTAQVAGQTIHEFRVDKAGNAWFPNGAGAQPNQWVSMFIPPYVCETTATNLTYHYIKAN